MLKNYVITTVFIFLVIFSSYAQVPDINSSGKEVESLLSIVLGTSTSRKEHDKAFAQLISLGDSAIPVIENHLQQLDKVRNNGKIPHILGGINSDKARKLLLKILEQHVNDRDLVLVRSLVDETIDVVGMLREKRAIPFLKVAARLPDYSDRANAVLELFKAVPENDTLRKALLDANIAGTKETFVDLWNYREERKFKGSRSETRVQRLFFNNIEVLGYDISRIITPIGSYRYGRELYDYGFKKDGDLKAEFGKEEIADKDLEREYYWGNYDQKKKGTPACWIWVHKGIWMNPTLLYYRFSENEYNG